MYIPKEVYNKIDQYLKRNNIPCGVSLHIMAAILYGYRMGRLRTDIKLLFKR